MLQRQKRIPQMIIPHKLNEQLSLDYSFREQSVISKLLPSSVVIPIFQKNGREGFLVIKRSEKLKNHPGQIAFPGGLVDSKLDSNVLDTALREWEEEVGASRNNLNPMGRYKDFITVTGFHISPIIAEYKGDYQFKICAKEVDSLFELYISDFYQYPFYTISSTAGVEREVFYLFLPQGVLWGATCRMLVDLLKNYWNFDRIPIKAEFNLSKPPFFDPSALFSS